MQKRPSRIEDTRRANRRHPPVVTSCPVYRIQVTSVVRDPPHECPRRADLCAQLLNGDPSLAGAIPVLAWRRAVPIVLSLVLLASLLVSGEASDGTEPTQGLTLLVGSNDEMKIRNVYAPFAWEDPHTMAVLARVFDTPVQRDPATGAAVPRLAVGIDADGDARLDPLEAGDFNVSVGATDVTVFYNFTNARFHDGFPVTAMDVLFSYHTWALHPKANGPLRVLMDRGGDVATNFTTDRWLGILAVDDGDGDPGTAALRFTLQYFYVGFAWATLGIPILPRHIWEGTGGGRHPDFGIAVYPEGDPRVGRGVPTWETTYTPFSVSSAMGWNLLDADVIGSGHFRFESVVFGVETRLVANPDYAFGPPKVDLIRFKVYRTSQLLVFALQTGEIDLILGPVSPEFYPDLQRFPEIALLEVEDLFPAALYFNLRRATWGYDTYPPPSRAADARHVLRRAIAHVVDRPSVVANLLQGHGRVADSFASPANDGWHNTSMPPYDYDLAVAAAILDSPEAQAAGIGADPPGSCTSVTPAGCRSLDFIGQSAFEILTPQADYDPVLASTGAMVADAMRQVGLNALSRPTAYGEILARVNAHDFDLSLQWRPEVHAWDPWTLYRGDPDYLWSLFHSSNQAAGSNAGGFWDAEFDNASQASRLGMDFMPRDFHVHHAQGVLADRLPAIPVFYRNWTWAYRVDRFAGWILAGTTVFNYWTLQALGAAPPPNPPPAITLRSPPDGSVIAPGTVIDLEVQDTDLASVEYAVDGGPSTALPPPFDVDTAGWPDGDRTLGVTATDAAGNTTTGSYGFTIDSVSPAIRLLSPPDGAVVRAGTVLDFSVADPHLVGAQIAVDGDAPVPLPDPYDYSMASLADGAHPFDVDAWDFAGNIGSASFTVTLDSGEPLISLVSPANGSLLPRVAAVTLDVQDPHFERADVSVDRGAPVPLVAPFSFSLLGLNASLGFGPGTHVFAVTARDAAGNVASRTYTFTWDPIAPVVLGREPAGSGVSTAAGVRASFSEAVNRTSVEAAFSLTDGTTVWRAADGTFAWTDDGHSFIFLPDPSLAAGRAYEVRLAGNLTDVAGNPMGADVSWSFLTGSAIPDAESWPVVAIPILAAVLLISVLVLLRRRKRKEPGSTEPPQAP